MRIVFVADVDVGAQQYMLSKAMNKWTPHKTRSIVLARNYLEHPYDLWLGDYIESTGVKNTFPESLWKEKIEEAYELMRNADFYVFRRTFMLREALPKELLTNEFIIATYGSEARENPGYYLHLSTQKNVMHVSSCDYSQSRYCGFSAQHVPIVLDSELVPPREEVSDNVRVVHAPTVRNKKLTDVFLTVAKKTQAEVVLVEDKTWKESLEIKKTCDINFDQMWNGNYGMSSVESWVMMQPSLAWVSGWTLSMYPKCPIVNVRNVEELIAKLDWLIKNSTVREQIGDKSYSFYKETHSPKVVAEKWKHLIHFVKEEMK